MLLVDISPAMALWRRTSHRVRALMEQTAAFRTVRTVAWEPGAAAGPHPAGRAGDHQLLLVLTDGGNAAWRDGRAAALLHTLASGSPTAVLNLLPQHLWELTLPTVTRTRLRSCGPGSPNRHYETRAADPAADALGPRPTPVTPPESGACDASAVAVPVVELRPESLGRWARLVAAADGGEWHGLAALLTGPGRDLRAGPYASGAGALTAPTAPDAGEFARSGEFMAAGKFTEAGGAGVVRDTGVVRGAGFPVGARGRPGAAEGHVPAAARAAETVRRFRSLASPTAFALARRLAAVPLNLPVMRLVQQSLRGAEFWNLAELVLRGLVRRTDPATDVEDPAQVSFDFAAGVREELLALGSRAETIGALTQVQRHLGPRLEARWRGGAALVDPDPAATLAAPPLTDQTRPFVAHLQTALRALSGPYLARADQLGRLLQQEAPPLVPVVPR
ncbi:hypothetical protein ACFVIM_19455 [Streptomyces sp. NPDC057638]|uniref:hypothetical protein n=1 Tax=Streptomyces sp. NPDC057638 TaxID=3346190 RepID=UPI00368AC0EA